MYLIVIHLLQHEQISTLLVRINSPFWS